MKPFSKREDLYLFFIFIFMAAGILIKSFLNTDGYLSPDSVGYLSLAQSLLDGNGFYTYSAYIHSSEKTFFAVWPVGYPLLIYLIAKPFGMPVFWASKTVNILCVGASLLLFRKLFQKDAYLYGLIFFSASAIVIFTHTWSEVPFIFGLLWLSAAIFYFTRNKQSNLLLLNLFFSAFFLFLCRYIGACGFLFIAFLSLLYFFKKDYKTFFKLAIISFAGFLFIGFYLFNNFLQTGFLTGAPRFPAPEKSLELLKMLFTSIIIELNIIRSPGTPYIANNLKFVGWFLFQIVLFVYFYLKVKNILDKRIHTEKNQIWLIFVFLGLTYLLSIISMRRLSYFVSFYVRLIGPATFLFLIAFISYVQFNYSSRVFKNLKVFLVIIFTTSFLLNVPAITIKTLWENTGLDKIYLKTVNNIRQLYSKIPANSVVVFPNKHLYYLRTDLIGLTPYCIGFASKRKEDMESFMKRINKLYPKKEVYFQIKNVLINNKNLGQCHESVIEFINNHQGQEFVRIK